MAIHMVTGPRANKTLDHLFLYPIEHEISIPEKSAFVLSLGETLNTCILATHEDFEK